MKRKVEQEMKMLYHEWIGSGKSQAEFAGYKGIVRTTFYYWTKKFRRQETHSSNENGFSLLSVQSGLREPAVHAIARINYPSGVSLDLYEGVGADFVRELTRQKMLALSNSCRYYLYRRPTDMRFGINSLAGLVRNELGSDPMGGDVFVFLGKRLNQIRLLQWDRDGFAMYIKKLERGTFEWPQGSSSALPSHQLSLLLQGVMLESVRMRKRYVPLKTG